MVDEEELDHVCSERETALDRPLHVVSGFFMVFGWFPWFFKVVSWFFMVFGWFPWFFMVFGWFPWFFQGSFMVFQGFWLVSMVFYGSRLVFHGFTPECIRPKLYLGPTIQSRSAARRAA